MGSTKIQPNKPHVIKDSDTIGLGWTMEAQLSTIKDCEKYVFKFLKEKCGLTSKLKFQNEDEIDEIESRIAELDSILKDEKSTDVKESTKSPVINNKLSLKRKVDTNYIKNVKEESKSNDHDDEIINVFDSDSEPLEIGAKKPKVEPICEDETLKKVKDTEFKIENDLLEFEAFNVKQEYLGYDEPIKIDSDSDSESEQWLMRLSQSSPGKPFMKISKTPKKENLQEDSYSQLDDFICMSDEEEDFVDDLISLPNLHPGDDIQEVHDKSTVNSLKEQKQLPSVQDIDSDECFDDFISNKQPTSENNTKTDEVDGYLEDLLKEADKLIKSPITVSQSYTAKKTQTEEPSSLKMAPLIEPDPLKKAQLAETDPLKKTQMISPMALVTKTKILNRTVMESKFSNLHFNCLLHIKNKLVHHV